MPTDVPGSTRNLAGLPVADPTGTPARRPGHGAGSLRRKPGQSSASRTQRCSAAIECSELMPQAPGAITSGPGL